MAKITSADVLAYGFRATQFGTPVGFDAYLAPIITDASAYVSERVGSAAYAASSSPALKLAEAAYVARELWQRRAAFADTNAGSSLDSSEYLSRREYFAHAEKADAVLEAQLDKFINGAGAVAGTGVVLTHAETGPFAVASA